VIIKNSPLSIQMASGFSLCRAQPNPPDIHQAGTRSTFGCGIFSIEVSAVILLVFRCPYLFLVSQEFFHFNIIKHGLVWLSFRKLGGSLISLLCRQEGACIIQLLVRGVSSNGTITTQSLS